MMLRSGVFYSYCTVSIRSVHTRVGSFTRFTFSITFCHTLRGCLDDLLSAYGLANQQSMFAALCRVSRCYHCIHIQTFDAARDNSRSISHNEFLDLLLSFMIAALIMSDCFSCILACQNEVQSVLIY